MPRLHAATLSVSARPSVSQGYLAVFSSSNEKYDSSGLAGGGTGKALGQAVGGGGLAWRDGALQNVHLGGTTTLEGDLDLAGHRLLNFDAGSPGLKDVEVISRVLMQEYQCVVHFSHSRFTGPEIKPPVSGAGKA